jgi:hypothetical protein
VTDCWKPSVKATGFKSLWKFDPVDIDTNCHKKRIVRHSRETLTLDTDLVTKWGNVSLQGLERLIVGTGVGFGALIKVSILKLYRHDLCYNEIIMKAAGFLSRPAAFFCSNNSLLSLRLRSHGSQF